jgi:DnaJ-class molecular chaperone
MSEMTEALAAIGATAGMGEDEIRSCYRARLRIAHPDHGGTADHLARVLAAWKVVQATAAERKRCPACAGQRYIDVRSGFQILRATCHMCKGTGQKG